MKITYTNSKGEKLTFGPPSFRITSIGGLGDVETVTQKQKAPNQDGTTYIDSVLDERIIPIELKILGSDEIDISNKRKYISRVFNPKLGLGELSIEIGDKIHTIYPNSDFVPIFGKGSDNTGAINMGNTFHKCQVQLTAPNPYWLTEDKVDQLVVWEGGLEFPLQLPTEFATQSGDKSKILLNDGDVETPIFVTFNGPATAPIRVVNKTSGKFIEVNQSLLEGERLEINTAFGQKRVTKVLADGTTQNAFHFITLDSDFFGLEVGNNLLDYSTGADYERAAVSISWRNRYVGI